jgi:CRISPR/Cas system-associated endoribonuclease Cas2
VRELSEKRKVQEVLDLLFGQVTQGLLYFYCAQSLVEAFQQSTLMQRSYFFFTVYEAAVREAILALSKLTRIHRDSITVYYLFNLVEHNPRLLSSDSPESVRASVADHKGRLGKYGPLIESVREQRDRVVAHLDKRHVTNPSDLFAHPEGVNLTELGECLREVLDILNIYAGYYGSEFRASHLESFISGDVDILLKWMREHGRPEEWIRPPVF